jgi:3D (Asp-Asp-Asp) domain-containing protein
MRRAALLMFALMLALPAQAGELWKVTAYCACKKCCGKTDGITASGKKVREGRTCAINWMKFGTKVRIEGLGEFVVEDRGARSLFGSKKNPVKHVDIYKASHEEARRFGVRWLDLEVIS